MPRVPTRRTANWGTGPGKSLARRFRLNMKNIAAGRRLSRFNSIDVEPGAKVRVKAAAATRQHKRRIVPVVLSALAASIVPRFGRRKV